MTDVFDILINPNYLIFWFFWGMVGCTILIKSWNKIMVFKYDMGTSNWLNKETDAEIISIYNDHKRMEKEYSEKYGSYEPINKYYHNQVIKEYHKRGLQSLDKGVSK